MTATELYGPAFFAGRSHTVALSASVVVPVIVAHLQPRSMLDLGCGEGEWVAAFIDAGVDATGVDIAAPEPQNRHDLTSPLDLGRTFDLVLSIEVGEHLPEAAADTLVESSIRHSDFVVFSAATVGQEGVGHINCQPHEYWHSKFSDRGYVMSDPFRPLLVGDDRVSSWYRNNLFMYERAA